MVEEEEEEVVVEVVAAVIAVEVEADVVVLVEVATEATKTPTRRPRGRKVHIDQQTHQRGQGAASSAAVSGRFSCLLTRTTDRPFSAAFRSENRSESSAPRRSWSSA